MKFRSDMNVELVDSMGGDHSIVNAARISSGTEGVGNDGLQLMDKDRGLINMLMRDRHGTPFEAVVFQWRIECPLFVSREFFRHRIASYNETSSRYRVLEAEFYTPPPGRPLVQEGKPGAYDFRDGTFAQHQTVSNAHWRIAYACWDAYEEMLKGGVAREVARNVLPLSIYTSFYVTMNLRSALNFLSLRWAHTESKVPTFPLWEIQEVAKLMDYDMSVIAPVTMAAFDKNGRVAP